MFRFAVYLSFIIIALYSSPSQCLMLRNNYTLIKFPPQCSVKVGNGTLDCKLKVDDVTDCCTDEQRSAPQHSYRVVNNSAITFNLSIESIHMFYLTKGCTFNYSYCLAILIYVPMELQVRGSEAVVEISKLPDFFKHKGMGLRPILRKTNVLVSDWDAKSYEHVHASCDALYNTSMDQDVRSDSVVLVAQPSSGLTDTLTAELMKHPCNMSCTGEEPQNCEGRVVQVKNWSDINEPLLFNQLAPGSFYCVIVRHLEHLNCAIVLRTFEYRVPKELALSERVIPKRNVHVILGFCSLLVAFTVVCGVMLIGSFVRGRGFFCPKSPLSPSTAPISSRTSLSRDSSTPLRHHQSSESFPRRILLLYSRDSPELCECMKALAEVLTISTHAEVLDPLNGLWGVGTEKQRDAGLPQWLYAVLRYNCSVLLLVTPGGKFREKANEKLEKVTFDPPIMLDDLFLLGFNYIKVQKASDYSNVFQISLDGIGDSGETYDVGVPLAKYILPVRLRHLISALRRDNQQLGHQDITDEPYHCYGCDDYGKAIMAFKRSLSDLKILYAKDPNYMDRTIVSTVNTCP